MTVLDIRIREKSFPPVGRAPAHKALEDLRITVGECEFVCVLGPSGCGKTTLLNCIAGLDRTFDGTVDIGSGPDHDEPVIGYVFQNPRLLPWRTVIENIELVLSPEQQHSGRVDELIAATGLEPFRQAYPGRLSLGLERRVALVRAFALQPDVLLMDEPFVSLDEPRAQRLRRLLLNIWQGRPTTVLFVTHDLREAIRLADRIVLLSAAPGTVMSDIPVDVDRAQRGNEVEVEAFRSHLIRDNPLFHGDMVE